MWVWELPDRPFLRLLRQCARYNRRNMEWPHFEEISLSELSADETGALVTELIGSHPELNEIRRRVILRSSGNPFFAEELVRSLEENCEVFGEIGDYRLGTTIAEGVLPATMEAVIGARIVFFI